MRKKITEIPIELLHIEDDGFHILMPAKINRKKANLLIDTGASRTVFDKSGIMRFLKSEEQHFEDNEKLSTGLGTNSLASEVFTLRNFRLGELRIKNYQAIALDMQHVNLSYEKLGLKPIDGVIGGDILMKYNAVLYYNLKKIKLYF